MKAKQWFIGLHATYIFCLITGTLSSLAREDFLLVGMANGGIHKYSPGSGAWEKLPLSHVANPVAVGYDPIDNRIYWSDRGEDWIISARPDGSNFKVLKNYTGQVDGLIIEPNSRLLYYTDLGGGKVMARHLETGREAVIVDHDVSGPRDIAVNYADRWVYWTDWGSKPRVDKARTDGSDKQTVFIDDSLGFTNGLHLDSSTYTLYVADVTEAADRRKGNATFLEIDLNGPRVRRRHTRPQSFPYHLEGNSTHIFIADWIHGLLAGPLDQPHLAAPVPGQPSGTVMGLCYYSTSRTSYDDPCSNNGGCGTNQLCLPSHSGSTCKCIVGYAGENCLTRAAVVHFPATVTASDEEVIMVVGQPADWTRTNQAQQIWTLTGSKHGRIAVDQNNEVIFFHDQTDDSISKYELGRYASSVSKVRLQSSVYNCGGLAFDETHSELFFSVSRSDEQQAQSAPPGIYKLNTDNVAVTQKLTSSTLTQPGGLTVDPFNRLVYWVDSAMGQVLRITSAGTDMKIIKEGFHSPTDIALDLHENQLYVTEGNSLHVLSRCGEDSRQLLTDVASQALVAVDLHQDFVFVGARRLFGSKLIIYKKSDLTQVGVYSREGLITDVYSAFSLPETSTYVPCSGDSSSTKATSSTSRGTKTPAPASSTTTSQASKQNSEGGGGVWTSTAVLAGIGVGGVVLLGLIAAVTVICVRRRKSDNPSPHAAYSSASETTSVSTVPSVWSTAPSIQLRPKKISETHDQRPDTQYEELFITGDAGYEEPCFTPAKAHVYDRLENNSST